MPVPWVPRGASFSSGGVRIVGQLGVLAYLREKGILDEVRDWYGCSGGCLTAFLAAIGVSAAWLRDAIQHMDMSHVVDVDEDKVADYMHHWGVNTGEELMDLLGKFAETWVPGVSQWTFADFAREYPGVGLHFIATNVTAGCLTTFSTATTPHVRIMDAFRASGSVPLFFTPWKDASGSLYCDGAVLEYFPWSCVTDKENTLVVACDDANITGRRPTGTSLETLGDYITRIFLIANRKYVTQRPRNWIALNDRLVNFLDFSITRDERVALFQLGERVSAAWLTFRAKHSDSSGGTPGSLSQNEGLHTLSSDRPSPDRTWDSLQSRNPVPPPSLSRGSRSASSQRSRRWSL
jgi:predicted acylesterase/phospholipase RssA